MHIRKYRARLSPPTAARTFSFRRALILGAAAGTIALAMIFGQHARLEAQTAKPKTTDITGYYQFSIGDTLALLDQHATLVTDGGGKARHEVARQEGRIGRKARDMGRAGDVLRRPVEPGEHARERSGDHSAGPARIVSGSAFSNPSGAPAAGGTR